MLSNIGLSAVFNFFSAFSIKPIHCITFVFIPLRLLSYIINVVSVHKMCSIYLYWNGFVPAAFMFLLIENDFCYLIISYSFGTKICIVQSATQHLGFDSMLRSKYSVQTSSKTLAASAALCYNKNRR